MVMQFNKNEIFRLIASNKVCEALKKMLDFALSLGDDARSCQRELIILSASYQCLKYERSIGAIKEEEAKILRNQILNNLLILTEELSTFSE